METAKNEPVATYEITRHEVLVTVSDEFVERQAALAADVAARRRANERPGGPCELLDDHCEYTGWSGRSCRADGSAAGHNCLECICAYYDPPITCELCDTFESDEDRAADAAALLQTQIHWYEHDTDDDSAEPHVMTLAGDVERAIADELAARGRKQAAFRRLIETAGSIRRAAEMLDMSEGTVRYHAGRISARPPGRTTPR